MSFIDRACEKEGFGASWVGFYHVPLPHIPYGARKANFGIQTNKELYKPTATAGLCGVKTEPALVGPTRRAGHQEDDNH